METQDNRPQWLIDAENEVKKAAQTKWGKMSDSEFRQYSNLIRSKEEYSERGKKGGATRASQESHTKQFADIKTAEHQKKASKKGVERNKELGNYKAFQEQATKAASIANSKHREDRMMEIINVLPSNIEFGFEEFTIIAEQFNRKWWYIKELNRFYPELVQKAGRGKFIKIV
jgi:hypothetical protein